VSIALVRSVLCRAILAGAYRHLPREDIEEKNWLSTGRVSRQEVVDLLNACTATNYSLSNHHEVPAIKVHEFKVHKTVANTTPWYLKFFFQPNNPGQGWKVYGVHPST